MLRLGEGLRRLALGLTGALLVARAYYPSEDAETGTGLTWIFAMLAVAGLAIASMLLKGSVRLRFAWADLGVIALTILVAWSSRHAADRRPAIIMAWEWGGLLTLYLLVRNLPATKGESSALAGAIVATAIALSAYGLFQVEVEFPSLRVEYLKKEAQVLARAGVVPGSPSHAALRDRVMNSKEVISTYSLANSLAAVLAVGLVIAAGVGIDHLRRSEATAPWSVLLAGATLCVIVAIAFLLTKSRSGWIGAAAGLLALILGARHLLPTRALAGALGSGALVLAVLIGAGLATGQLDREVLTESSKSLKYRLEYWAGAWGIITDAPPAYSPPQPPKGPGLTSQPIEDERPHSPFWQGVGPANFAGPYLKHKLPVSSEEIRDPHNLILDVWASSGLPAVLALVFALVAGVVAILRSAAAPGTETDREVTAAGSPPRSAAYLVVASGLGWLVVVMLGKLNPLEPDLTERWMILGVAWAISAAIGSLLWRRRDVPAIALGAAVIALTIHLLAAGGISQPSVAMFLWVCLALGLNLRDDRATGRPREVGRLGVGIVLAVIWAAVVGSFYGAISPGWRSQALILEADTMMRAPEPKFDIARKVFEEAAEADRYAPQPWLAIADLEFRYWLTPMANGRPLYTRVNLALDKALDPPRDPNNLGLRRQQANYAREILKYLDDPKLERKPKIAEILVLRTKIVSSLRKAATIYPTNAFLRYELALASADVGAYDDAIQEAGEALKLSDLTPHKDKKLPEPIRKRLEAEVKDWNARKAEAAKQAPEKPGA